MARGRLAKIGMLRRLIRVKSTLPHRPLAAPCLAAPRRPSRRAAPPATVALLHVPLVGMALLHVPLVGMALLHAQGPRSAQ